MGISRDPNHLAVLIQKRIKRAVSAQAAIPIIVPGIGDLGALTAAVALLNTDVTALKVFAIVASFDGGGSAIPVDSKFDIEIPWACTIDEWELLLDQADTFRIDVWNDSYGNYPPTGADSMPGATGDRPQTSAAAKASDDTAAWDDVTVAAGSTLRFNVDVVTAATRATLILKARRT